MYNTTDILLIPDSNPIPVIPCLAEMVGINAAVVLQQVYYWCETNRKKKANYRNGHYWTYGTYEEWAAQFSWMGESTVRNIFKKLEKSGFIISGNFNRQKYDRTKWYRVDKDLILREVIPSAKNEQMEPIEISRPVPETDTETKNENMRKDDTYGIAPANFSFDKQDNIFKQMTEFYGHDRAAYMLSVVDWYIDKAYPAHTGRNHQQESKAKRMTFVAKLLSCTDTTYLDDEDIAHALERAIKNFKNCDPTIYWITTSTVLGYWLIQDEEIGYESINQTEYAPVDAVY